MHRLKRQAKYDAWYNSDENSPFGLRNPFGKYNGNRRPRTNSGRIAENGDSDLLRVETAPNTSRLSAERAESFRNGKVHPHPATSPEAYSNPNRISPGADVDFPKSSSPANSIHHVPIEQEDKPESGTTLTNGSPTHTDEQDAVRRRDTGTEKKGGIKGLFKRKKHDEADEKDDNNGKQKKKFTFWSQIRGTVFNSWVNVLLIMSPVGIAVHFAKINPIAIFVINFIAIIPLAGMLSYATEEIALRVGEVLGGLLNASFGNAVELIVSIIALAKDQTLIVQTSLIGSILSNLLLVMGMCFFFGGINRIEQAFNMTVAQTAASLLFLAVSSLIIPTAFDEWANIGNAGTGTDSVVAGKPKPHVADLSRGTAIMLLVVYGCYLFFQLKSHAAMYNAPSAKNEKRNVGTKFKNAVVPNRFRKDKDSTTSAEQEDNVDEPEEPQLSIWTAVITLAGVTVLVALNAEFLVDSINDITCGGGISKNFVGLILLPIVGNAAEHATAVTVACKDKMDLAIGVAVGSSMQIALLVLPFTVVLGWIMGKDDMTLFFDGFQIAVLFVAVLLVNYLIQDGKSHWLEGVLLMTLYIIIAVAAWFYPTAPGLSDCPA